MEGREALIDDEVKIVAIILIGVMASITIYPILAENKVVEPFSELGILGPKMKLGDYPTNIFVGEDIHLYLYVGNHEGRAKYYEVQVKLGDKDMNVSDTTPLNAPKLATYDFVLPTESNQTFPITLSISKAGLNQRLVFEMWTLSSETGEFVYHQRWNQLWLNVTSPI